APPATSTTAQSVPTASITVTRVIDGDTIQVRLSNGSTDRVRLVGVDAPETGSPNRTGEYGRITDLACLDRWGARATSYLRDELEGRSVTLEVDPREGPRDSFDRLLAYVTQGGQDINASLVELGYARVYTEGRAEREDGYLALQRAAQQAGLGLWSCEAAARPQPRTGAPSLPGSVAIVVLDLAGEAVLIRNQRGTPVDMTGWVLVSEVGNQRFVFPPLTLAPSATVEVLSGTSAVHSPPARLRWTDKNVWNDGGDSAALFDRSRNLASRLDQR
ncbi:MAG: hypothetical protein FJ315_08190, partial [SAR202 cluster bacterium]|nr:hypothetical protein [SAR202 cluster bacterium]